jgi:hypothetical protein
LETEQYGSRVAVLGGMLRPKVAGWQLPYLRVALILRRLETEPIRDPHRRRELAHVVRVGAAVRRAGWFN